MSVEQRKMPRKTGKKEKAGFPSTAPSKGFTPSPPTSSKPVVIPTRCRNGARGKTRESVPKKKGQDIQVPHDALSTPPSMAAVLAMTSRPEAERQYKLQPRRDSLSAANRRTQISRLRHPPQPPLSSTSPRSWDTLLSPPDEPEFGSGSFDSDRTLDPLSSARSLSTESMPSLEADTESLSSSSNPATPVFLTGNRTGSERRQKSVSTSLSEECALDHPLLPPTSRTIIEDDPPDESNNLLPPTPSPRARSTSYFKSNLTASFRRIRSAAQSFSAFTAPPTQKEDYLARSLLLMDAQYTDERRPQHSMNLPDPALRRYLNPTTFSPAELHFHSEERPQIARPSCTASIQLQSYQRHSRSLDKASSPPVFLTSAQQNALDAVDGLPQASSPRQREPRENSNFLRVIVLEMNMRRKGKLGDASPGRAKLWLPARQAGKVVESALDGTKVPERWVALQP